jgi:hypothetical protein
VRLPGVTHLVALAQDGSPELGEYIETKLERKFQLEINRGNTLVVDQWEGAGLDFLGYTFGHDRDLKGRGRKYLNAFPSKKAVQRERDKLREMTNSHPCFKPIPDLIDAINRHLASPEARSGTLPSAWGVPWKRVFQKLGLVRLGRPAGSGSVHA